MRARDCISTGLSPQAETFTGLCCCLHVDDYESGVIRRHEQTRYDKEEDRTRHIGAVNAHTGPVVLIYRDTASLSGWYSCLAADHGPDAEVHWQDGSSTRSSGSPIREPLPASRTQFSAV